ncbi:MAG: hypothetical protein LAN63_17955 [Acidobacteriia bacterium]|nr:hypothetical protein [Terriglobia bacterium]
MPFLDNENLGSNVSLASLAYYLSIVVLATALVDLFINRLLFRAGPDVLKHVASSGAFFFGIVGRISITLEQILLFLILTLAAVLLFRHNQKLSRLLGSLFIVLVVCSALLYAPLTPELAWAASLLLVLIVAGAIAGLGCLKLRRDYEFSERQRLVHGVFLLCVILSFIFPLYYRVYLLAGAAGMGPLPLPLEAYLGGVYFVMASMIMTFLYALQVPARGFTLRYRDFAKAAILPTIIVAPTLYEMMSSFFVLQILSLVVAMSTDFVLSHTLLEALVLLYWFFLTAVLLIFLKGHYATSRMLKQEAVGLVLIMSTTFLFNYPYYLMLGTAGVFLLCYSLSRTGERESSNTSSKI